MERRGLFLTHAPCPSGASRALPCISLTPESRLSERTVIRSSPLSWWQKETEPLRATFKMPFSRSDCQLCSQLTGWEELPGPPCSTTREPRSAVLPSRCLCVGLTGYTWRAAPMTITLDRCYIAFLTSHLRSHMPWVIREIRQKLITYYTFIPTNEKRGQKYLKMV